MRLRFRSMVGALLVAFFAATAFGRAAEHLVAGQKLFAEVGPNETVTVIVDLVRGTSISLQATAYRGTATKLDVSISDATGQAIDLGTLKKANAKLSVVSVKGFKPDRTGTFRVAVSSVLGTQGGFDLAITGTSAKKVSGKGSIDSPGAMFEVPVEAIAGDTALCVVTPARKSKLKPWIDRFVDAGGATTTIGAKKQATPIAVATTGAATFFVAGDAGSTGAFNWTVKYVRTKASRTRRDAAQLNAVGTIRGVVAVDGQTTHGAEARPTKSARKAVPDVRPGELVVSMKGARSWADVESAAAAAMPGTRCTVKASLTDEGPYLVDVEHLAAWGKSARAKSATRALAKSATASGALEWCSPNAIVHGCDTPTDPYYPQQFNMGQLNLPAAWSKTTGLPSMVVAIVDTGSLPHPDLNAAYLPGYDFVTDPTAAADGNGWDSDPTDAAMIRHGTHVAGLVGARANNGIGVAGAAWNVKLLPVRVLGVNNTGSNFDVAAGLRWAVGLSVTGAPANPNPARVVNMSLGSAYDDPTLRAAVAAVFQQTNAVIVAAAGNDSSSNLFYPAAYPGVINVYALDLNLKWTSYTNYGSWIFVGAPGGDSSRSQPTILSTYATTSGTPTYSQLEGTSMASPQVAGVVALVLSVAPQLSASDVKDLLKNTATDLGPAGFDNDYGWGIVNADAAITAVMPTMPGPDAVAVAPTALSFDEVTGQAGLSVFTQAGKSVAITAIDVTTSPGSGWLTATADHMTTPATLTVKLSPTLAAGAYSAHVKITTAIGVADVPVTVVRAPSSAPTFVTISAVDGDGRVVARATATAASGWAYQLDDVPLGAYRITTFIDANGDQQFDRVDEFDGIWPLRSQPQLLTVSTDSLDADDVNLTMDRFDTLFDYAGVGSGLVGGALAVRVADARTGVPVAGASVYFAGGAPVSYTDARGRALVVGGFSGGQMVTVAAAGYSPMTRAAQDGQYQGFAIEPLAAATTSSVSAAVKGCSAADRDVWLQFGDAKAHAVYDGVNDPTFDLTVTQTPDASPVSAVAYDVGGVATKSALFEIAGPSGHYDVTVAPLSPFLSHSATVQPTAPAANFTAAGATATSTTSLRWNDVRWVSVGDSTLALGQSRAGAWADPQMPELSLLMKFEILATDATGRWSRAVTFGTSATFGQPSPPATTTLDSPPALLAPLSGAVNVAAAPLLSWSVVAGGQLHKVVVEQVGTSWRWTIWVPGTANQVQLPAISAGGLASATNYRWSVETFRFGTTTFSPHSYLDDRLDVDPTSRVFSGWATFKTQ